MERDSLNFKNMSVGRLFIKQLLPTLLGMISSALFIIVDGIFVGRGIGSDAMAAVNIVAPLSMIMAGLGLMFGMGGGILASINLSREKTRIATINATQSTVVLLLISLIITLSVAFFPYQTVELLGSDAYLKEQAVDYLFWFAVSMPFLVLTVALPFFVRLTNPNLAMWAMLIATFINLVLDYVFIFEFNWGLFGAAVATGIGEAAGAIILVVYLLRSSVKVHFARLKMSTKSIRLTMRNASYMMKLGFSTFLSEVTLAVMAITGNYVFMDHLGPDGVAAFSIICYLFPIIFMFFNATIQSAQPIISYNYGCGQIERSNKSLRMALGTALLFALVITAISICNSESIVSLFIPDRTNAAWGYATTGLPLFAIDYAFFGINVITIGYFTSIERIKKATLLTIWRGILPVVFFFTLPLWLHTEGIWLAVATGDIVVTIFIVSLALKDKVQGNGKINRSNQQVLQTG